MYRTGTERGDINTVLTVKFRGGTTARSLSPCRYGGKNEDKCDVNYITTIFPNLIQGSTIANINQIYRFQGNLRG